MESLSETELRELAWDIHAGKVFTNRHIRPGDESLAGNIFMILLFMERKDLLALKDDFGMVFEYYDKALPRAINGYPMFLSCRFLNRQDTVKVLSFVDEIVQIKKGFESGEPRVDDTTEGPENQS